MLNPHRIEPLLRRPLTRLDALANRLYGWRYNPLYQSGSIVVALLVVLIVTGIWLLLFYRVGAPWASVAALTADPWLGNWVRGLHRYASDAALIAAVVHALRMFAQGRSWGPRTLAWVSGLVLMGLMAVCGVTGFIMVWDTFGYALAIEVARLLDALPVLSEPMSRAFVGERPVSSNFFFLNVFVHSALPLAMGLGLWIHVSRLARVPLLPPRRLMWTGIGLLIAVAVVWPLAMAPEANPFTLPRRVPADWFSGFWVPLSRGLPAGLAWLVALAAGGVLLLVPWAARPRAAALPPPSEVDERLCTACNQCVVDCPYEAITMVPRHDGRAATVARVNPARCVSCGICAGSCAPMGVGPQGRTGRDQRAALRGFLTTADEMDRVVAITCTRGAAAFGASLDAAGALVRPVECTGSLHTSVIDLLLRNGARGVLILACPPRDCAGREGPRLLEERVYHDREAELKARVDRRRVRIAYVNGSERTAALAALRTFEEDLGALGGPVVEPVGPMEAECEPVALEGGRHA
jgi:ferredoxin